MQKFDPMAVRARLDDNVGGYIAMLLSRVEEERAHHALASWSDAYLNDAVKCILVGYGTPADRCLHRAYEWLNLAIAENERPNESEGNGGPEAERHHNLALCNWLLNNQHDEENFALAVKHREKFFSATKLGRDNREVSLTLPQYVDAGACKEALARSAEAGIAAPTLLGAIKGEGQMAYVLCRQRQGKAYKADEVNAALDKFLHRNVERWLGDGLFLDAAEWMKIAHWKEGGPLTAKEAVMKCYDYLPGVTKPEPVARKI